MYGNNLVRAALPVMCTVPLFFWAQYNPSSPAELMMLESCKESRMYDRPGWSSACLSANETCMQERHGFQFWMKVLLAPACAAFAFAFFATKATLQS